MKKLILSISVVSLLGSCGSKGMEEKKDEGHNKKVEIKTVEVIDEAPQSIMINSYDFLTKFKQDGDDYINSLKGKKVVITQIIVQNMSMGEATNQVFLNYMVGYGYNGALLTLFSDPENGGKSNIVEGKVMPQFIGPLSFDLANSTTESQNNFINAEMDGETQTETFHTSINIAVPGDNITSSGGAFIKIDGAKIELIENF